MSERLRICVYKSRGAHLEENITSPIELIWCAPADYFTRTEIKLAIFTSTLKSFKNWPCSKSRRQRSVGQGIIVPRSRSKKFPILRSGRVGYPDMKKGDGGAKGKWEIVNRRLFVKWSFSLIEILIEIHSWSMSCKLQPLAVHLASPPSRLIARPGLLYVQNIEDLCRLL